MGTNRMSGEHLECITTSPRLARATAAHHVTLRASGMSLPPFPDNVPTHPLLIIDYKLLKAQDRREIDRLWHAGTNLGFW